MNNTANIEVDTRIDEVEEDWKGVKLWVFQNFLA